MAAVCYLTILLCVGFFVVDGILEYRSRRNAAKLQARLERQQKELDLEGMYMRADALKKQAIMSLADVGDVSGGDAGDGYITSTQPAVDEEYILPEYLDFYRQNSYFSGWLSVEGTGISYPVMQGPDNLFYLSHDIDDQYDKNGMLVMDIRCNPAGVSPQYLIYGHNVQSGRMFGELLNYKDKAYYRYHPTIQYDSLYERGEYDIVAVVLVQEEAGDDLPFYEAFDFGSEEEFQDYMVRLQHDSLYETKGNPVYGEPLLTLVTCEYSQEDGRLAVIACKNTKK